MDLHETFSAEIDALAISAVEKVGGVLGRDLTDVEGKIALSLFWSRTVGFGGDWVDIATDPIRVVLEPNFEQGFVALAVRVLRGGRRDLRAL